MKSLSQLYADRIVRLIREDMQSDPEAFAECRSFTDLHDVVDANMYFVLADMGLARFDDEPSDLKFARYNKAVPLVEEALGWR